MKVKIKYKKAPLPFVGQKRYMLNVFAEAMAPLVKEDPPVYDLFGGSGLLANACAEMGFTNVTYNDFDGYAVRLRQIPTTNTVLESLAEIMGAYGKQTGLPDEACQRIRDTLEEFELLAGPLDAISISPRILFSMNYHDTVAALVNEKRYYANSRGANLTAEGYLQGVRTVSKDYRELLDEAKRHPQAVLIVDPPYLSTEMAHYKKDTYWNLTAHLELMHALTGRRTVYFTSNKSQVPGLVDFLSEKYPGCFTSPLDGASLYERPQTIGGGDSVHRPNVC